MRLVVTWIADGQRSNRQLFSFSLNVEFHKSKIDQIYRLFHPTARYLQAHDRIRKPVSESKVAELAGNPTVTECALSTCQ